MLSSFYWLKFKLLHTLTQIFDLIGYLKNIDLDDVLVGGANGLVSNDWIQMTKEYNRASCLLKHSAYVKFLEEFKNQDNITENEFKKTEYYQHALCSFRFANKYFSATTESELIEQGRFFLQLYQKTKNGVAQNDFASKHGHSITKAPAVFRIFQSNCYEILDGHHRLAISFVLGEKTENVIVLPTKKTYLQKLVLGLSRNRNFLDMPVETPEFNKAWHLKRQCEKQFELMISFLKEHSLINANPTVVDLACSYGWFVKEFRRNYIQALGINNNMKALTVGKIAYGLQDNDLLQSPIKQFIEQCNSKFDVTLFLDVLSRDILRRKNSVSEILRSIDNITKKVLFCDFRQNSGKYLSKADEDRENLLVKLLKDNTGFKEVVKLQRNHNNSIITLFACIKRG